MASEEKSMSVWKVLGGAAAGVAVVAAGPVAAPVALGLGALSGGLLGAIADTIGRSDKAFLEHKYKDVLANFEEAVKQIRDEEHYNELLAAMVAVSVSCAASDGDIARKEKSGISEFLKQLTSTRVSHETKSQINDLIKNPPDIDAAFHFHNTRGLALAGVLVALGAGIARFESSVGGLGGCPFAPVPRKIARSSATPIAEFMSRRTAASSAEPDCFSALREIFICTPRFCSGFSARSVVAKVVGPATSASSPSAQPAATELVTTGHSVEPDSIAIICAPIRPAARSGNRRSMIGRVVTGSGVPPAIVSPARASSASQGTGTPR